jgi:hypothetical protein
MDQRLGTTGNLKSKNVKLEAGYLKLVQKMMDKVPAQVPQSIKNQAMGNALDLIRKGNFAAARKLIQGLYA